MKCKHCNEKFKQKHMGQKFCLEKPECREAFMLFVRKKDLAARKKKLKKQDKSFWTKQMQDLVNKYVRLRDKDKPCISCGTTKNVQYHAGHYMNVNANKGLRFNLNNIFKQCSTCNNHLSGNLINYRINLVKLKGEEFVKNLEAQHRVNKKYDIAYLEKGCRVFKKMIKRLERRG